MKACSALVLLALVSLSSGATKKLPSYLQFCKRSDPNFDSCSMRLIESIRPQLAKGIPQIHAPPLEPFSIPALQIDRDTDNLQISATLKNLKVNGPSQFQLTKFRTDLKNNLIELGVLLPHLQVTTNYDIKGRLLVVPLNGKGLFKGNITDVRADLKMNGKLVDKRGKKYFEVADVVSKIKVGDTKVDLSGGNNQRNDLIASTTADFVENNRRQVLDVVNPVVEETANAIVQQIANRILSSLPYDTILPP
ncbi:circadian clock-controlled protein daywake-like [Hetaerina americana]|uniref:circadian clock-controlled protein daywake-like n=1 Tax=Hetaerina americana TaxID=62018 RepID=UPI003A7F4BF0